MTIKLFAENRSLLTGLFFYLTACGIAQAGTLGMLTYAINGDEVTITDCDEGLATGAVAVPSTIEGKSVTSIGDSAFSFCRSMKSIALPASITGIDNYAFWACSSLDSINIPDSVTSIGLLAFRECTSLTNIEIPVSVASIGDVAFGGCSDLLSIDVVAGNLYYSSIDGVLFNVGKTEILVCPEGKSGAYSIPSGVTRIGEAALYCCSLLTVITIPDSVNTIGHSAFGSCSLLTGITIPDSVNTIGYGAFRSCSLLASITIPDSVTSIGRALFRECSSLSSITLPGGITSIGDAMFMYCSSLTNIVLPSGISSVGGSAFSYCSLLTDIMLPSGVTSIGSSAFKGCSSLTSMMLPSGISSIGDQTFRDCSLLENIALPSGITSIGSSAFSGCSSLAEIEFPSGVASIGDWVFSYCSKLSVASFLGDAPVSFGYNVFKGTVGYFTIYYRVGSTGFTSPTWEGYPAVEIEGSISPSGLWLREHGFDYGESLDQDMNGDGVDLLMAYALNLDPNLDLSGSRPQAEMAEDTMSMTYYAARPGITYTVETSTGFLAWTTVGVTLSDLDPENRCTATVDLTAPHRFLRLRVE